jgi:hypothetical protein
VDVTDARRHLKQPHVICDCEALAALRFRHLGHYFLKPSDIADIYISQVLHFVESVGMVNAEATGLLKRSETIEVQGSLWCLPNA